jgi:hypothetical protein
MPAGTRTNKSAGAEPRPCAAPDMPFARALSTFGLPWAGLQEAPKAPIATPPALAQLGLMQIELAETYLNGARRLIDLWRASVREQQDQLLRGWRTHLTLPAAPPEQSSASAMSVSSRADGADRSQQPAAMSKRARVDHAETTVLAREH